MSNALTPETQAEAYSVTGREVGADTAMTDIICGHDYSHRGETWLWVLLPRGMKKGGIPFPWCRLENSHPMTG